MVELLVYARDDGEVHPLRYRPGDVVDMKSDGAVWGDAELGPECSFRVIVIPDVSQEEVIHLLEMVEDPITRRPQQRRRHCLNMSLATSSMMEWWHKNDGTKYVLDGDLALSLISPREV